MMAVTKLKSLTKNEKLEHEAIGFSVFILMILINHFVLNSILLFVPAFAGLAYALNALLAPAVDEKTDSKV